MRNESISWEKAIIRNSRISGQLLDILWRMEKGKDKCKNFRRADDLSRKIRLLDESGWMGVSEDCEEEIIDWLFVPKIRRLLTEN